MAQVLLTTQENRARDAEYAARMKTLSAFELVGKTINLVSGAAVAIAGVSTIAGAVAMSQNHTGDALKDLGVTVVAALTVAVNELVVRSRTNRARAQHEVESLETALDWMQGDCQRRELARWTPPALAN